MTSRNRRHAMTLARSCALALTLAVVAVPSARADDAWLDPVRAIAVQDGGRAKPLDTFARESARRVTGARAFGADSVKGLDPVEWLLAMMADPGVWREEPIVRVSHAGLREALGLAAG